MKKRLEMRLENFISSKGTVAGAIANSLLSDELVPQQPRSGLSRSVMSCGQYSQEL